MVFWKKQKPPIDLDVALQSIPWSTDFENKYKWKQRGIQETCVTPVYLAPVKRTGNSFEIGLYVDDELRYVPFGFRQQIHFGEDYYVLSRGERIGLVETTRKSEVLYLPVRTTTIRTPVGANDKDGNFVPHSGSPFKVMTLDGLNDYPFLIFNESDEIVSTLGFHKDRNERLDYYRFNTFGKARRENIRAFLRSLENGEYVLPEAEKKLLLKSTFSVNEASEKNEGKDDEDVSVPSISSDEEFSWDNPRSIKQYLDEYVIGQDSAKKTLAVAFSNYMTRKRSENHRLPRENILLIGPSGVGKTYMISLLAKKADLPWAQAKLTGKSSEGYKGSNLSMVFGHIRSKTKGDSPYGVVFLDEIDKLARPDSDSGSAFGIRLQDEMIGWLEEATIDGERGSWSLDTSNLLFITAGAFQGVGQDEGLTGIIQQRLRKEIGASRMGFGAQVASQREDNSEILRSVTPDDLIKYGLKPELLGRLPSIGVLSSLSTEDKIRILKEASGSRLHQYRELFKERGYFLTLEEEVYQGIVDACPKETGARALNSVCNDLFTDILFDPREFADENREIVVTVDHTQRFIRSANGKNHVAER